MPPPASCLLTKEPASASQLRRCPFGLGAFGSSLKKLMCFMPKVAKSKWREPSAFSTRFHLTP